MQEEIAGHNVIYGVIFDLWNWNSAPNPKHKRKRFLEVASDSSKRLQMLNQKQSWELSNPTFYFKYHLKIIVIKNLVFWVTVVPGLNLSF